VRVFALTAQPALLPTQGSAAVRESGCHLNGGVKVQEAGARKSHMSRRVTQRTTTVHIEIQARTMLQWRITATQTVTVQPEKERLCYKDTDDYFPEG
jgi:hypothetical protein